MGADWATIEIGGQRIIHRRPSPLRAAISGGKITAMETDWATIEINGAQRIIHRAALAGQLRAAVEVTGAGRYCSQKEKAHSFLLSVRLGGHVQSEYPSGRAENPRQSFRPLTKPSPAGFLLTRLFRN